MLTRIAVVLIPSCWLHARVSFLNMALCEGTKPCKRINRAPFVVMTINNDLYALCFQKYRHPILNDATRQMAFAYKWPKTIRSNLSDFNEFLRSINYNQSWPSNLCLKYFRAVFSLWMQRSDNYLKNFLNNTEEILKFLSIGNSLRLSISFYDIFKNNFTFQNIDHVSWFNYVCDDLITARIFGAIRSIEIFVIGNLTIFLKIYLSKFYLSFI